MARNKRSLANRKPFTPLLAKQVCDTWPLLERFAVHQTTTRRWNFEEDVQAYRALGIRALGAWRFKVDDVGEHKALDLLLSHEMTVSSLSWAGGFVHAGGPSYHSCIADARDAVHMAAEIQAGCLVVLPGSRGAYTVNHGRKMIIEALRRVGDLAGELGVQIALQPTDPDLASDSSVVGSLDQLLGLLVDCGHPHVGLNLDLFPLRSTPALMERVPELLPWIRLVQLSDCRQHPSSNLDRCVLGQGRLPLTEMIESLEAVGYRGFYEATLMSTEVWSSGHEDTLRDLKQQFATWSC